ncbi:MAG: PAS domain S-box protein [Burkholderiales bacterium]|nr:PAS domain S-box protein [Burkholderiales bacterium]
MPHDLQARVKSLERQLKTLQAEYQTLRLQGNSAFQQVFYRIAERATAGLPFYDFLKEIHSLLKDLLPATNLYVALVNHAADTLSFPYYVDERDGSSLQVQDVPRRRGLTEYVLRTGIPQLIDAERFAELKAQGEITEATGDLTFTSWLGVPLLMHGVVSGALVVQSYTPGDCYSGEDADVLGFVANHLSNAIERYRAIEAMRQSEGRYRSVVDNLTVGLVVIQDGRVAFINPSMARIAGHSLDRLLARHYAAAVHPDDLEKLLARKERRQLGAPLEPVHTFRVVTAAGEIRYLEASEVVIEWESRAAVLAFMTDITDRLSSEQAQKAALQQQTKLNDMKTRFISMTSHEFRTPLASIHGSVELLKHYENRMPPDKKRQILQNIDDAVERMTHMLGNVLQIGRAEAGQLQFRPKPLALNPFCLALVDELRNSMPHAFAKITLTLDLCAPEQYFLLDEALIRNIVGNLLSNAIKYSPQGGSVTFSALENDGIVVLTIADQGIGIPTADQEQLFQTFHRASNVGGIAGTGLGLSIVKEAVNCHRGTIEVHSVEGQGSQFTVMLPTSTEPA